MTGTGSWSAQGFSLILRGKSVFSREGIPTDISLLTLLYCSEKTFSLIVVTHAGSLFNTCEFSAQASLKHGTTVSC